MFSFFYCYLKKNNVKHTKNGSFSILCAETEYFDFSNDVNYISLLKRFLIDVMMKRMNKEND